MRKGMHVSNGRETGISLEQAMIGILALLAAERDDRLSQVAGRREVDSRRTEVLLAESGLTADQISKVLGKKPDTVRKTLSRAAARSKKDARAEVGDLE